MHRRIANKAKEMEVLQINYKTILREGNTCSKLPGPHRICAFAALTGRLCCSCRDEKAFLWNFAMCTAPCSLCGPKLAVGVLPEQLASD